MLPACGFPLGFGLPVFFLAVFFAFALASGDPETPSLSRIRRIEVEGNSRVPAESILHLISASPGSPYDEGAIRADLKKLNGTGLFENLEITSREAGEGRVDLHYRVREYPFLSSFEIEGIPEPLVEQFRELMRRENLTLRPAAPFHPEAGNRLAVAMRGFLRSRRYPFPEVTVATQAQGSGVRVVLKVNPGPHLEVGEVRFTGNAAASSHDLIHQMKCTRPSSLFSRWSGAGRYSSEDLTADVERLRQYYQSRGYASVALGNPETFAHAFRTRRLLPVPGLPVEKTRLAVEIPVTEGPHFQLGSVRLEGEAGVMQSEVAAVVGALKTPRPYGSSLLERTRNRLTQILGRAGYAMAQVELAQTIDSDSRLVHAVFKIDAGFPVLVGRINFEGNSRLPDKYLRRELRLQEGEVYNSVKLDESIERLNRTGLIEELRRTDVALKADEERRLLDVIIKLKEKKHRGIYATGGTGGAAGGYLGIIYTAFNLLGLGEKLSFELDGGASQSNLLLDLVAGHFLGTPFTIALAGVNRLTNINVASLIPNQTDLIGVLRSRQTGAGLAGSYPISTKVQLGLGFQVEREAVTREAGGGTQGVTTTTSTRSDLSPSFIYDSTAGSGPQPRGYRIVLGHSWSGTTFLRTVDSIREAAVLRAYKPDPLSSGRNLFAFQLQGITALPSGSGNLALERRLFPGDELVRGFRRGALGAWSFDPASATPNLQPAGANSALGLSAEYRVPLGGPLRGAAFLDLGWTELSSAAAGAASGAMAIAEQTNRLLRMSTGGELRIQLPGLQVPARLIFAWNPLRLDTLVGGVKPQKLVDPRGSFHFALGNLF